MLIEFRKLYAFVFLIIVGQTALAAPHSMADLVAGLVRSSVLITVQRPSLKSQPDSNEDSSRPAAIEQRSITGVIIGSDGDILTVAHVFDRVTKITVKTSDGVEYDGSVKAINKRLDVALIHVASKGAQAAKIGSLEKLRVAEPVLAVSMLPSLHPRVVDGIVSAFVPSKPDRAGFIQTTLDLPPEMEGSGLIDEGGRVIGINVNVYSKSSQRKMGFAIPIDDALAGVSAPVEEGQGK